MAEQELHLNLEAHKSDVIYQPHVLTSTCSLLICPCDLSVQEIACLEVRHLVSFNPVMCCVALIFLAFRVLAKWEVIM